MIAESHTSPPAASAELAERLVSLIAAVGRRSNVSAAGALSFGDLSISQVRLLHLLNAAGGQSVGDLATRLGISAATASRACDGLSRAGLVERREDADDRRIRRVHPTPTGVAYVEQFAAAKLDAVRELLTTLDAKQQQRLLDALAPLVESAGCAR
jgi:DNA-binding MarR family transcriptional regulator